MAIAYCYFGYAIKKYNLFEKLQKSAWTYCICIPVFFAQLKWGFFDLSQGKFENITLDYIAAGISGLLFLVLLAIPENYESKGFEWLKQVGMYSYWIMVLHSIEMEALPWWYWQRPLADRQMLALFQELILKTIMYIVGCKLLKHISKRRYLKKMKNKSCKI